MKQTVIECEERQKRIDMVGLRKKGFVEKQYLEGAKGRGRSDKG